MLSIHALHCLLDICLLFALVLFSDVVTMAMVGVYIHEVKCLHLISPWMTNHEKKMGLCVRVGFLEQKNA